MTDGRSNLHVFMAFALFPLASRLLLIVSGVEPQVSNFTVGLLADIYWSFLLTMVATLVFRNRLWAVLPLFFLWVGSYAVDVEHITALGQLAHHSNIQYLFDLQFIANSMGALSPAKLLASTGLLAVALWLLITGSHSLRRRQVLRRWSPLYDSLMLSLVIGGASGLYLMTPAIAPNTLVWQDRNFFAYHLDTLAAEAVAAINPAEQSLTAALTDHSRHRVFAADLQAARPVMGAARNVLLIAVEGLSGAYIESVARRMGLAVTPLHSTGPGPMPQLSALAEQSLLIPNFISHRTQTIRGLYSLLCSDFPKLDNSAPKPLEILGNDTAADRCLPRLLRKEGYSTHYFQAANLQFMSKNTVMPFIGFDDVRGREAFALPADYYFDWGPDDSDFFIQSADWLDTLAQQKKPWFTTLLTVGTHHPYALREGTGNNSAKLAAVAAADSALAVFIARLQASGIADDTLILITSDESHGVSGRHFGSNWGMMVVLAPDLAAGESDDVFSTADVTLSVMDYLNFLDPQQRLTGRSLFRDYSSERTLLFSDSTRVSLSTAKGLIVSCPMMALSFLQWLLGTGDCEQLRSANGEMFAAHYQHSKLAEPQQELYQLQAIINERLQQQGGKSQNSINIANNAVVPLRLDRSRELAGGQYLNIEKGTLVTLELDVSYAAQEQSILELSLVTRDLKSAKSGNSVLPVLTLPSITHSERIKLQLSFPVFSEYSHVQIGLQARSLLTDGEAIVHSYRITTEKKERFDSLSLQLLEGTVTAANGTVATLFKPMQAADAPLTFVTKNSVYTLGSTEHMANEKSFLKYGGAGWWGAEAWGRWSKAQAGLNLFLNNDSAVGEQELLLTAQAKVYSHEGRQQVEVWGNGELLDTWELSSKAQAFTVTVPAKLLDRGLLSLNFVLQGPLSSPQQRRKNSNDKRQLGMGLIEFTLSSAAQ
ncbi:MAG: hypothetical protein ACI9WS_001162 [Paraglaciecola psychrophila]|jgi:hypothetical protein